MNRYKLKASGIILLIMFLAFSINAQTAAELSESNRLERQSIAEYKAKKYADFLANMKRANDLRPNHPRIIYNLAIAYSLNKDSENALISLKRLAAMGLYFQVEKDEDFKSLFELKDFQKLKTDFAKNIKPVNRSSKAFSVPQKGLITEGIAYDSDSKRFFLSSVREGKIIVVNQAGEVSDFSSENDGLWSVSGLAVDNKRKVLWATTSAFPQFKNFKKEDEGKAGIFKYSLESGKLLKKYLVSIDSGKHAIGDLILTKNGDVFATDSISPQIYLIDAEKDKLEVFLKSGWFSSLQGLTFSANEEFLFVADYSKGIFKINLKSKEFTQIKPNEKTTLLGIDGLYFHKGNLITIQNGVRPHRVVQLNLDKDFTRIKSRKILEANHADFMEPTLGVKVGNDFYYIANSQWNLFDRNGNLNQEKLTDPVILKLKL
jgi:WD40 repeat protein